METTTKSALLEFLRADETGEQSDIRAIAFSFFLFSLSRFDPLLHVLTKQTDFENV
jgi:hypothetical protein